MWSRYCQSQAETKLAFGLIGTGGEELTFTSKYSIFIFKAIPWIRCCWSAWPGELRVAQLSKELNSCMVSCIVPSPNHMFQRSATFQKPTLVPPSGFYTGHHCPSLCSRISMPKLNRLLAKSASSTASCAGTGIWLVLDTLPTWDHDTRNRLSAPVIQLFTADSSPKRRCSQPMILTYQW